MTGLSVTPFNDVAGELCVCQKLAKVRQQALHGWIKFLPVLYVEPEPECIFKTLWRLVGHAGLRLATRQLIDPVKKRLATAFTQCGGRNSQ